MGYCITQTASNIFIPKELFSYALKEIKEGLNLRIKAALDLRKIGGEPPLGGGHPYGELMWVDIDEVLTAKDFCDALRKFRWRATLDSEGHLCNLSFLGEKLGDDFPLFKTIAPYVKEGGYISMVGEDHKVWRWFFDGEKCIEQRPRLIWE